MNDSLYGLTAAIYGNDEERATAMLRDVQVGTCYWNACDRVSPFLPWTGVKHSGIGSTLGLDGIRNLLRPRAWHMRHPPALPLTKEDASRRLLYNQDGRVTRPLHKHMDTEKRSIQPEKWNDKSMVDHVQDEDLDPGRLPRRKN